MLFPAHGYICERHDGVHIASPNRGTEREYGHAAPDTDRVVCPDATVQLDGLLTATSGGGPTPLFRVAQLACWAFAASVCGGTFVTPSLAEAHRLRRESRAVSSEQTRLSLTPFAFRVL